MQSVFGSFSPTERKKPESMPSVLISSAFGNSKKHDKIFIEERDTLNLSRLNISANLESEQLFHERVPFIVKSSIRESRVRELTVDIQCRLQAPQNQYVLSITLTDESDPFFLYSLQVSETEFHQLKTEQTLLVDFNAFPKSIIHLLQQCLECHKDENPKFVAVLRYGAKNENESLLCVQETNQFRHLQHICLRLKKASDHSLKEYLGNSVMTYKSENTSLKQQVMELNERLQQRQEECKKSQEYANEVKLKTEQALYDLKSSHTQQLSDLKNTHMESSNVLHQKWEAEKHEMSAQYKQRIEEQLANIQQLSTKCHEFETHNDKLNEQLLQTQKDLKKLEQEYRSDQEEMGNLRNESKNMDTIKFEQEKQINQLNMKIAAFQQQIQDKIEISQNNQRLLDSTQEQKKSLEEALSMHKTQLEKSEKKVHDCIKEINKGNSIISRLQAEIRNQKNKNKLVKQSMGSIEEKVNGYESEISNLKSSVNKKNMTIDNLRNEIGTLKDTLRTCKSKLEQSHKAIQSNQRVISYLNKQINEKQMGGNLFATNTSGITGGVTPNLGSSHKSRAMPAGYGGTSTNDTTRQMMNFSSGLSPMGASPSSFRMGASHFHSPFLPKTIPSLVSSAAHHPSKNSPNTNPNTNAFDFQGKATVLPTSSHNSPMPTIDSNIPKSSSKEASPRNVMPPSTLQSEESNPRPVSSYFT